MGFALFSFLIMMTKKFTSLLFAVACLSLCACRVETSSEEIPEAEGSGKKAINIRVEPMSTDEMKDAANTAIDKGAAAATVARDAATSAVQNAEKIGQTITTLTDTVNSIRNANQVEPAPASTPEPTPTP